MSRVIHARLDDETEALRLALKRSTGWADSEIVRTGIKTLASLVVPVEQRISGLGEFDSGITGLGSNKKHLEGFGR